MPRPRSLTQDQVAAAALAVIDRDGLTGLSMRAVAKELKLSTMALYRYVRDREELEGLVIDLVYAEVDPAPPPGGPWEARIETMALRLRAAFGAHAAIMPLTLTHRHDSAGSLCWGETVAGILHDAGITGPRAAIALRTLIAYIIGAIQLEHLGPLEGEGTAAIAALPAERFPNMAETARHARHIGPGEEFRGGLAAVLRGLEGA
ncbi:TetR/AcrR family transcriptional regulator [Actinomadura violacea]|uniref:TetR/AcrR family transcriptional regulator C-terminal domain-containing protein n=1 Tax=Actinomadura violacea TaxID=2819934 RepID=A0ABS3S155_9ACTN|nr:TetR/AcrR family transcriptional regulator C-terminal domain-containing protein [Actinomadura violacea]MBO2462727.1 TetR/AcrR family transcriptional regulator C-terminal domain-containing protein [Actinomadura violacea]